MAVEDDDQRLPCGTRLSQLADQVIDGIGPADAQHQAGCPHCQAALDELSRTWADFQGFTRQPSAAPPGLSSQIVKRIRVLAARHGSEMSLAGERGETRIPVTVLAQIARRAAVSVPGVVLASALEVGVDAGHPSRIQVALRLVVDFGPDLPSLAAGVRSAVAGHMGELAGVGISTVDITIDDIVDSR